MREKIFSILKLFVSLLLFFCVGIISTFILKLFGINIDNLSSKYLVIYQSIISLLMFIILFILYRKEIKEDFKKFIKNIGSNIISIIKLFIIFMIVKYIVSFISILIISLLGMDIESITSVNQNIIIDYVKVSPILMVVTTSIFAPLYEETLFRLGFKKVLNKGILFIIISGLVFGLLHIFPLEDGVTLTLGIIQSISYVTMGIFLSYVYNKTDNIFISIGIHFLNNFISILTMINMM